MQKSSREKKKAVVDRQTMRMFYRIAAATLVGYVVLTVAFYFLAGEQLHLRQSRGEVSLPAANAATGELVAGSTVEQRFSCAVERIEQIDVQWGNYYRANTGTALVELYDGSGETCLLSQSFDVSTFEEGSITTIRSETPIEGFREAPLLLRISSPDSQPGSAVAPLICADEQARKEGWLLTMDGAEIAGTLCFALRGTDYIWTGLHYWQFVEAGLVFLLCFFSVLWLRCRMGKHSYLLGVAAALRRYGFLIRQLVARDFKLRYRRSILGAFWSFLNPLMMMCVQYFVFSTVFRQDIENFAVYLLIGVIMFNFFSESCGMMLSAIVGNASLIMKVYVPKYIYPLTRCMSSVVNLSISLLPLLLVTLLTGVHLKKSLLLALYFIICLIIFSLGLGLLLSSSMVFFRDTQYLWSVFQMAWMYATPIFYPESILPENLKVVLQVNPLYHFLKQTRLCILDGISPEPAVYVQCLLIALAMLVVGALVFKRTQNKFILYL